MHHIRRKIWVPFIFLAPALAVLGLFGLGPFFYALALSVQEQSAAGRTYIGLEHYQEALTSEGFRDSVFVTLWYAIGTVPLALCFSLLIALALFRIRRFAAVLRTAVFLPYVTSTVAAAMIWRVMVEPREGPANVLLQWFGLPPQNWLLEPRGILYLISDGAVAPDVGPSLALVVVILFEIWRSSGFMIVLLLAGLAAIPNELEQSARLDGATDRQVTLRITLPLLTPTLFFLSVVGFIQAMQAFSGIYALTGDGRGPLDTTQNMTVYLFTTFWEYGRIEYGAAVAVLLTAGIMLFTIVQWTVLRRQVHYQ